jgi:hypothetical protein
MKRMKCRDGRQKGEGERKKEKRDQITAERSVAPSPSSSSSCFSAFVAPRHLGWVAIIGAGIREEFNIESSL